MLYVYRLLLFQQRVWDEKVSGIQLVMGKTRLSHVQPSPFFPPLLLLEDSSLVRVGTNCCSLMPFPPHRVPVPGMETHIAVLFLDLNGNGAPLSLSRPLPPAPHRLSLLPVQPKTFTSPASRPRWPGDWTPRSTTRTRTSSSTFTSWNTLTQR